MNSTEALVNDEAKVRDGHGDPLSTRNMNGGDADEGKAGSELLFDVISQHSGGKHS